MSGVTGEKAQLSATANTSQVSESQCHDDDVFSSLLGDKVDIRDKQLSSRDGYIVNGEDVSATIATFSTSDWVIQSASIYKSTLLLLAKEKGSQDNILQVLRSKVSISLGMSSSRHFSLHLYSYGTVFPHKYFLHVQQNPAVYLQEC